jgi:hypothetical protein
MAQGNREGIGESRMKPSLKLLYYSLERASMTYAETGSPYAQQRAIELIGELHQCLDDVEQIILSEERTPTTGESEAQG